MFPKHISPNIFYKFWIYHFGRQKMYTDRILHNDFLSSEFFILETHFGYKHPLIWNHPKLSRII